MTGVQTCALPIFINRSPIKLIDVTKEIVKAEKERKIQINEAKKAQQEKQQQINKSVKKIETKQVKATKKVTKKVLKKKPLTTKKKW